MGKNQVFKTMEEWDNFLGKIDASRWMIKGIYPEDEIKVIHTSNATYHFLLVDVRDFGVNAYCDCEGEYALGIVVVEFRNEYLKFRNFEFNVFGGRVFGDIEDAEEYVVKDIIDIIFEPVLDNYLELTENQETALERARNYYLGEIPNAFDFFASFENSIIESKTPEGYIIDGYYDIYKRVALDAIERRLKEVREKFDEDEEVE